MATPSDEVSGLFLFDGPSAQTPMRSQEVRNDLTALAQTNIGSDPAKPAFPREGMMRILKPTAPATAYLLQAYLRGAWRTQLQLMESAHPTTAKLIFPFGVATNPWVLQHNLGSMPVVQVLRADLLQRQLVLAAPGADQYILQHADDNRVNVTFSGPVTGFAIVVG